MTKPTDQKRIEEAVKKAEELYPCEHKKEDVLAGSCASCGIAVTYGIMEKDKIKIEELEAENQNLRSTYEQCCQGRAYLDEKLMKLEAEVERLKSDSPGTPLARINSIHQLAEQECGHSKFSSRPPELAIKEKLQELTALCMAQEKKIKELERLVEKA